MSARYDTVAWWGKRQRVLHSSVDRDAVPKVAWWSEPLAQRFMAMQPPPDRLEVLRTDAELLHRGGSPHHRGCVWGWPHTLSTPWVLWSDGAVLWDDGLDETLWPRGLSADAAELVDLLWRSQRSSDDALPGVDAMGRLGSVPWSRLASIGEVTGREVLARRPAPERSAAWAPRSGLLMRVSAEGCEGAFDLYLRTEDLGELYSCEITAKMPPIEAPWAPPAFAWWL